MFSPEQIKAAIQAYKFRATRFVEGQSFIATRALVDSDEEQLRLEELLDASKPPAPSQHPKGELHYLLYTPFRYPPLKHGGRFHKRFERSLFYASENVDTAAHEIAYYRFLFLEDSEAELEECYVDYSSFEVSVFAKDFVFLSKSPFVEERVALAHPESYSASQALGSLMREAGVEAFDFFSARCDGRNYALFTPEVFAKLKPEALINWKLFIEVERIGFHAPYQGDRFSISRENFMRDGRFLRVA